MSYNPDGRFLDYEEEALVEQELEESGRLHDWVAEAKAVVAGRVEELELIRLGLYSVEGSHPMGLLPRHQPRRLIECGGGREPQYYSDPEAVGHRVGCHCDSCLGLF